MTLPSIRSVQIRLFILLMRAFTVAVLFITLVILGAITYFLSFPSNAYPIEHLPIITRLATFHEINNGWQGIETLVQNDQNTEFHQFWIGAILLDSKNRVVVDHGSIQTSLVGTVLSQKNQENNIQIMDQGKLLGTLVLDPSFLSSFHSAFPGLLWPIISISFLMAIPTIIIGLLLMRRLVNPLAEVITAAQAVSDGDLSTRVHVSGSGDLRALADSFNQMTASLEQNDNDRRNMLADIAHELRTPLTVIRGRLEGFVDGVYTANSEQVSPALEETYLLERLVDDLHLLTLAEKRQLHFERARIDLNETIAYVIDLFQAEADEKSILLTFSNRSETPLIAFLDPQRIKQILGNLVSNALRYTNIGGKVDLGCELKNEVISLYVVDNGPGVPAEDLPFIFQRFWRGEKSRSRISGGAGLGLAISRQLVEAQGGQIRAENNLSGGLKITITFPVQE